MSLKLNKKGCTVMNSDSQKYKIYKLVEKKWYKSAFRWLVSAMLIAAIVTNSQPALAFSTNNHKRITRNAFPFMIDDILDIIVEGNLDEDLDDEANMAERHAVNCQFRASAKYYNMRYEQVVDALREPPKDDTDRAARLFGHLLHGVQDFYSHSNWIPTPPEGLGIRYRLLDSGLGYWTVPKPYTVLFDDVMIIEGNPPEGVNVRLPTDANGRVSSAVPIVQVPRFFDESLTPVFQDEQTFDESSTSVIGVANMQQFRGLMTAGAPRGELKVNGKSYWLDQRCPPVFSDCKSDSPDDVCLRHGEGIDEEDGEHIQNFDGEGRMNLDGGWIGYDGGDWFEARHYAKLQTQHEWCRLLHLSRDLDPSFVASGRLLGTWVATDSGLNTPHLESTACARGAARSHLIEISATPGTDAPLFVPFVVFRSDFTSSARTIAVRQATRTLRICGNTDEKIVASLMPARIKGATLVVQVPETAKSWIARDHRGEFSVSFTIKVTPNVC
jgi:hypothetical protein